MTRQRLISPKLLALLGVVVALRVARPLGAHALAMGERISHVGKRWRAAQNTFADSARMSRDLLRSAAALKVADSWLLHGDDDADSAARLMELVTITVDSAGMVMVAIEPEPGRVPSRAEEAGVRFEATGTLVSLAQLLASFEGAPRLWRMAELSILRESAQEHAHLRIRAVVRALRPLPHRGRQDAGGGS